MISLFRLLMTAVVVFCVLAGARFLRADANADLTPQLIGGGYPGVLEDYRTVKGAASEYGAKIALGNNANAVLSLDLIADGGAGNRTDDGVTVGPVTGRGTTIAIEIFATGVTTSLRGIVLRFDFDASLVSYVKAENSAFALSLPEGSVGVNLASGSVVTLAPSGFLARAEFETVADVTGRAFSIGIESVTLAESPTSSDRLTTTSEVRFNAVSSPDFDGDGTVGFSDFLAFAGGFGKGLGDSGYEARFDLDGDGTIGFPDFLIFAGAFGSHVPPAGGGGGKTPSGPAPADQNAFDRLAVGRRFLAETYFVDFVSAGRFTEGFSRHEGSYAYTNTGPNTGNFTQMYDNSELFGGRCTAEVTFTTAATGTVRFTCADGTEGDALAWRMTNLSAPVFARSAPDSLFFGFLDTWRAGETRAYDWGLRTKAPQGEWNTFCKTFPNTGENTITAYAITFFFGSGLEAGATYETRYRYRNSSSCNTGSPDPWSPIAEGTTAASGTGGGGPPPPSGSPDLTVESASVSNSTLTTGQSFTLRATVRNQGNAAAAATTLRYYRSSNATVSKDDTEVGTDTVRGLPAGGTSAETISLNAPSDAGTYYYGGCVDGVSAESNTDNNCSSGVSVTVSGGATGGGNLGACRVGLVVRPNQSCTVTGGSFINIGGGCYNYTPFGNARLCGSSFNLNGLRGTRSGSDFRITAVP